VEHDSTLAQRSFLILPTLLQPTHQKACHPPLFPLLLIPFHKLTPKLANKIIIRRLSLLHTQPTHDRGQFLAELQPREHPHNLLVLLHRDGAGGVMGPQKIGQNAHRGDGDFGLLVQRDTGRRMQRNGVPDQLRAVRLVPRDGVVLALDKLGGEEVASDVGAVDLEALVLGEQGLGRGPAHVVEEGGEGDGFGVGGVVGGQFASDEKGEGRAAKAVVESGGGCVRTAVGEGGEGERGRGDGYGAGWERGEMGWVGGRHDR
jgi:hypothetical protein